MIKSRIAKALFLTLKQGRIPSHVSVKDGIIVVDTMTPDGLTGCSSFALYENDEFRPADVSLLLRLYCKSEPKESD